jgi:hypothetical protein
MRWIFVLYTTFRWFIALSLIIGGCVVCAYTSEATDFLMWKEGYERVLGAENVRRLEDGTVLLTNPIGQIRWQMRRSMPFFAMAAVMIVGGLLLMFPWRRDSSTDKLTTESRPGGRFPEGKP